MSYVLYKTLMQRTKIPYYLVMEFAIENPAELDDFPNALFSFRRFTCPNTKTTSRQLPV